MKRARNVHRFIGVSLHKKGLVRIVNDVGEIRTFGRASFLLRRTRAVHVTPGGIAGGGSACTCENS